MNMRLLGARHIGEVVPDMLDASSLSNHIVAVPGDNLYNANCEPPPPPARLSAWPAASRGLC